MKRIKIVKKKNNKFKVMDRFLFWWEPVMGTYEFDTLKDCLDFIYENYENECKIIYDKIW